jgi:hypothetical protein
MQGAGVIHGDSVGAAELLLPAVEGEHSRKWQACRAISAPAAASPSHTSISNPRSTSPSSPPPTRSQIGYIRRRPEIIVDRQPMDVAATLRDNGCHSTEHEVEFHPARVGMGPRVMLRVTCLNQRKKVMDEFQAVVPCKHEGHEEPEGGIRAQGHQGEFYSSMTMADLAAGLQNIFFERNKGWQQNALPVLRYYGKAVDGSKQGEDVFKYYRGEGLYQDKISIELDVKPFVEELTPEQEAAKHAISTVVSEVLISMANM